MRDRDAAQALMEFSTRGDAELDEHVAQVPLDRAMAEEELRADLLVRQTLARQLRDLALLRRQIIPSLRSSLAAFLARAQQLVPASVSERLHTQRREHVVCDAQLVPCLDAPVLPPQPFPIQEVGPGELDARGGGLTEMLDRLQIKPFGGVADADESAR